MNKTFGHQKYRSQDPTAVAHPEIPGTDSDGKSLPAEPEDARIAVDGFNQVLEMLRIADPAFRESLLKRLAKHDPRLARSLRHDLSN
jgi:hypothetical protein